MSLVPAWQRYMDARATRGLVCDVEITITCAQEWKMLLWEVGQLRKFTEDDLNKVTFKLEPPPTGPIEIKIPGPSSILTLKGPFLPGGGK